MGALPDDLTPEQQDVVRAVREFVEKEIIPTAHALEHDDTYPTEIVRQMKELGFFGLAISEKYGGTGLNYLTYAHVCEEIARGWMSITGIINTHFIVGYLLENFGTEEQKKRFLPSMATGEMHGAFSMSEPSCGSDVQAITTRAVRDGDEYVINGNKMWVTNGARSTVVATLVKTDPDADPRYKGMSCILAEKKYPGVTPSAPIEKLGYKGVETTELVFEDNRQPASNLLGGEEGRGFAQMMSAIEVGRINVAARGVGVARRAFELAIVYAQQRRTFGKPIAEHQAIEFMLADMATQIEAARLLTHWAARMKDAGVRADKQCGMAKLFASEACKFVVDQALRIHGGYGYSKEFDIERLYRDAPLLVAGEGTSEMQRIVIARELLKEHAIKGGPSRPGRGHPPLA
jgi:butyryl-CoA dehydrogenase